MQHKKKCFEIDTKPDFVVDILHLTVVAAYFTSTTRNETLSVNIHTEDGEKEA